MNKLYDRIDWHNNTTPAINETNLNRMSKAVDDIDDRVVDIAGTVMETVSQIQEDLEEAQELLEDAQEISTHPPIIGQNGNWWTWDTSIDAYADSGVDAGVSLTIGTTSTLTPGSDATVTNSGTATDPILNFGIPAGVAGQNGQDGADGADGVSPTVTIGTITGGHSVTITDADHPSGQTFDVMDGTNGGHTILDGSGSAMNQRSKLQFDGLNVTDDSGNDKTVVTAPTPDYVDAQYNSTTTYSKGMTCISGNKRYRYINSTASSGHQPPNSTYWEVLSVASQLSKEWQYLGEMTGLYFDGSGRLPSLTLPSAAKRIMVVVNGHSRYEYSVPDASFGFDGHSLGTSLMMIPYSDFSDKKLYSIDFQINTADHYVTPRYIYNSGGTDVTTSFTSMKTMVFIKY